MRAKQKNKWYSNVIEKIMVMKKFLSTTSLNINDLNCPIKRHRLDDCIKNMIPLFAIYKKLTPLAKTYTC
jgi:hypothetical protein